MLAIHSISSYLVYSPRNLQLPERFVEADEGWRGLEVPIAFLPYLDEVYMERPQTFVGMMYMNRNEHLTVGQWLGQVIWDMHRTSLEVAIEEYVQRVRGIIHDLNRQGLRLTWLSEYPDIVEMK